MKTQSNSTVDEFSTMLNSRLPTIAERLRAGRRRDLLLLVNDLAATEQAFQKVILDDGP